jgi:hypothetical protein
MRWPLVAIAAGMFASVCPAQPANPLDLHKCLSVEFTGVFEGYLELALVNGCGMDITAFGLSITKFDAAGEVRSRWGIDTDLVPLLAHRREGNPEDPFDLYDILRPGRRQRMRLDDQVTRVATVRTLVVPTFAIFIDRTAIGDTNTIERIFASRRETLRAERFVLKTLESLERMEDGDRLDVEGHIRDLREPRESGIEPLGHYGTERVRYYLRSAQNAARRGQPAQWEWFRRSQMATIKSRINIYSWQSVMATDKEEVVR